MEAMFEARIRRLEMDRTLRPAFISQAISAYTPVSGPPQAPALTDSQASRHVAPPTAAQGAALPASGGVVVVGSGSGDSATSEHATGSVVEGSEHTTGTGGQCSGERGGSHQPASPEWLRLAFE